MQLQLPMLLPLQLPLQLQPYSIGRRIEIWPWPTIKRVRGATKEMPLKKPIGTRLKPFVRLPFPLPSATSLYGQELLLLLLLLLTCVRCSRLRRMGQCNDK